MYQSAPEVTEVASVSVLSLPAAESRPTASSEDFPNSSVGLDWLMGVLSALLVVGIVVDGWAHTHGKVDQSFFTPWHALLYSMMALNGLVLGSLAVRNLRRGHFPRRALPYGYGLSLVGVILFAAGGVLDLLWHTVFGIEADLDALLSPTHLILAVAAMLIFSGPLRSIGRQYDRTARGWLRVGPVVPALLAILILFGFFLAYAQPIEDRSLAAEIGPDKGAPVTASLYALDAGGAVQTRLSIPPNLDIWGVTAAPDGRRIAYRAQAPATSRSGALRTSNVFVARADGSAAIQITRTHDHATQPAWSPDGAWLAYIVIPAGSSGDYSLHVVRPDGSRDRVLRTGVTELSSPAWSPDGRSIAYGSREGVDDKIAVIDVATGSSRWLEWTHDADTPTWLRGRLVYASGDGSIRGAALDGTHATTLLQPAMRASAPTFSPDGTRLAFLANTDDGTQLFLAAANGSHPENVSRFSGGDVGHPAWLGNDRLIFTAGGNGAQHAGFGSSLALASLLLQSVLIAGILLVAVRRWRVPVGTFTLVLPAFALAMAAQSDAYVDAIPAFAAGLCADVALLTLRDALRSGLGFYLFAALLPGLLCGFYLVTTIVAAGGTAWTPDMLLGAPLLSAAAGLAVAFCYDPPIPEAFPRA
jgi:Tol biopolymer transport system component